MVDFKNKAVFCIASGPSLTKEDCQAISGLGGCIAVNNSWQAAPHCDIIFAGDESWWRHNKKNITIQPELWSSTPGVIQKFPDIKHFRKPSAGTWNSGIRAIELAAALGSKEIYLLGYDCSVKNGVHWHGLHKNTSNPNADKCKNWKVAFNQLALLMKKKGVEIINLSRYTELKCFPRISIEEFLNSQSQEN
jgi:hypothetical protein